MHYLYLLVKFPKSSFIGFSQNYKRFAQFDLCFNNLKYEIMFFFGQALLYNDTEILVMLLCFLINAEHQIISKSA